MCTEEPSLHSNAAAAPPASPAPPQRTLDDTLGNAPQPDSMASGVGDAREEHVEAGVRDKEEQPSRRWVSGRDIDGRALVLSPRKMRKQAQEAADTNARVIRKRKHDRDDGEKAKKRKVEKVKGDTENTRKSKEADKKGNGKDK